MTTLEPGPEPVTARASTHPLDPLTAGEIQRGREILTREGKVTEATRFPLFHLKEPAKDEVMSFRPGEPLDRRLFGVLLDTATGDTFEAVVSVTRGELDSWTRLRTGEPPYGQAPIMLEEFGLVDEIVKADGNWRAAVRGRGLTDVDSVFVAPLSAGFFDFDGEHGRRMLRALSFARHHETDSPWAHPIDGLVAYVDLIERRVIEVIDHEAVPVPAEQGNYTPEHVGPPRASLRPLEITQPEGPSFDVDGHVVTWENWRFRVSFDQREGLVLHEVGFRDGGRVRPVVYRASVAEMVVPYADPSPVRFWQSYFDVGEYTFGKQVNSLALGCDCLGEIYYFDTVMADDRGEPRTVPNVVCMHEEDYGVLWKHTDDDTGRAETRRSRRLVVSFFVTVGNYDYGFYWYFYQDGSIQLEGKATGVLFTAGVREGSDRWATEVAPGLGAPLHQHLFCARLDMAVDGTANTVEEADFRRLPMGGDNPYGNAFTRSATAITRESEAGRLADPQVGRVWRVTNPASTNRLGQPVAYKLTPAPSPTLLADPGSSIARRAVFATRHLWVSRYHPAERFPAGDYPNQHMGGAGIPAYTAKDRDLEAQDVVLWHTFGVTHAPRPEDWPVMPVDYIGFTLKPEGFFDRNPALDLPAPTSGHCVGSRARGTGGTGGHGAGHCD